jgi:leucyl-tRNA synthetase
MAGWYPAQEEQLPVILPFIEDFKPMGTGTAPLANHPEFYETSCPRCGSTARRETDVSDTFLDSSWYFFRYTSTEKKEEAFTSHRVKKWLPVTMYIGGAEHSVLHLLYSRFVTMVLSDLGYCDFEEPFTRFFAHGLLVKEGAKMSKSKGNVVIPDAYIRKSGADTLRTYLMFLGPFSQGGDFYDTGIEGMHRFLKRVWFLFTSHELTGDTLEKDARRILHKTVKKVTEDVSTLRYNTAIAALMEYYNFLAKQETVTKEERDTFLKLLAPFAPHLTEELWQMTHSNEEREGENGPIGSLHVQPWPTYDPAHLQEEDVTIAIQVNGKLRGSFTASVGLIKDQEAVEQLAKVDEKVQKYLEGKTLKKVIYVPGKIINFVI